MVMIVAGGKDIREGAMSQEANVGAGARGLILALLLSAGIWAAIVAAAISLLR